jgi:hypothetical protein
MSAQVAKKLPLHPERDGGADRQMLRFLAGEESGSAICSAATSASSSRIVSDNS